MSAIAAATVANEPVSAEPEPGAYGSRGNAYYILFLVFTGLLLAFVDRMIISVLIEPLKTSLSLSDTNVSLLQGVAFVLFYAAMTFPFAVVADRIGYKSVIVFGIVLWSLATTASAFSTSFLALFTWRLAVGAGQAALGVGGAPLLAKVFPKARLGSAIGVYSSGSAMGAGASLIVGGALLKLLEPFATRQMLGLGALEPWRATTLLVGLPGLALALAFLLAKEPKIAVTRDAATAMPAKGGLIAFLAKQKFFFFCLFALILGVSTYAYGVLIWSSPLLVRRYGLSLEQADIVFVLIMLIIGTAGAAAGGWLSDVAFRFGWFDAPVRLMTIFMALGGMGAIIAPFLPGVLAELVGLGVLTFLLASSVPMPAIACQYLSPPGLRAQMIAMSGLFENVLCGIIGSSMVAVVTDSVFHDPLKIHLSYAITLGATGCISVLFGLICSHGWKQTEINAQAM